MDLDGEVTGDKKENSTPTEHNRSAIIMTEKTDESAHPDNNCSIFSDGSCGEPLVSQHLVLDFTPLEDVDTDFVQKKCCAFWDFIRSQPEFDDWLTLPESDVSTNMSSGSETCRRDVSDGAQIESYDTLKGPTAISMLELLEGKGLIDRTFEAKLPQSHCSLGSREYQMDGESTTKSFRTKKEKSDAVCTCKGVCELCTKQTRELQTSPAEVHAMCEKMTEWDIKHPKSMEPPGHAPALIHCIMQRKKVYPNSPCPLFGRTRRVVINQRDAIRKPEVVRICQAPVDDTVETPCLSYAEMAKKLGAWDAVQACCAFCKCGSCCSCGVREYILHDADRAAQRRPDMRAFDARVKTDCQKMRIMYDKC